MNIKDLRNIATASELVLINKVEELVVKEANKRMLEKVDYELTNIIISLGTNGETSGRLLKASFEGIYERLSKEK